jgi:ABC-type Zn uptake system ZnuABC Zn-binding protein ZnuA
LASIAQQIFSKDLGPIAPANAAGFTANIEKYINQLKNAVENKTSYMNLMNLVHVKLHPTMITALERPEIVTKSFECIICCDEMR